MITKLVKNRNHFSTSRIVCGDIENRIKERQLDMFAGYHQIPQLTAQQIALTTFFISLRADEIAPASGPYSARLIRKNVATVHLKLLKFGNAMMCNTLRVRYLLAQRASISHGSRQTLAEVV